MTQGNIYLDFNATSPVHPEVKNKLADWLELWGNPSSIHQHGRGPKRLLRESRRSLAQFFNCHPLELVFTSGGSESNNLAIKGVLSELKLRVPGKNKVILGSIEHPSVLNQRQSLEKMGYQVELIPVSPSGQYDMNWYEQSLDDSVALVSVMLANNEVGVIAPVEEMVKKAHRKGAIFHSDLVQALGKWPFSLQDLNVDLASFSAHKVYALKGCGLLYIKKGTPFQSLTHGGSQERRRRAGTENLMAIASLAQMTKILDPEQFVKDKKPLRDSMESLLKQKIQGFEVLCEEAQRLPNTSCFMVEGVSGESLLMNLDIRGFSVGTGAACSSGNPEPSPVLLALGLKREQAQSSLRISMGNTTTGEQIEVFVNALTQVVDHLRNLADNDGVNDVEVL